MVIALENPKKPVHNSELCPCLLCPLCLSPKYPSSCCSCQLCTDVWCFFLAREYYSFVNTSQAAMGWQNLPPYHFPPTSIWSEQIINRNSRAHICLFHLWNCIKIQVYTKYPKFDQDNIKNVHGILLKPWLNQYRVFIIWKRTYIVYAAWVYSICCMH